jgi:flagellar basal body-associated protein FliL
MLFIALIALAVILILAVAIWFIFAASAVDNEGNTRRRRGTAPHDDK